MIAPNKGTGDALLPQIKLTVRFTFASGEQAEQTVERSEVSAGAQYISSVPYRLSEGTASGQPVLITSANFAQID